MEIKVSSFEELILNIKKGQNVSELVKLYGDAREEKGVEDGWKNCNRMFRKLREAKKKKLKETVIHWDDTNMTIGYVDLVDLLTSTIDESNRISMASNNNEVVSALECLMSFFELKLGKGVSLDRRLLFSRRYSEKKERGEV